MDKPTLIAAMRECATLMELAGENPFKVRAYEQGARALETLEGTPRDWVASGTHLKTQGIGKGLAKSIEEWAETGQLQVLVEFRARVPGGLIALLQIPGLGARKIQVLHEKLGIDTIEKLEAAARCGELGKLAGFGTKTAERILLGIQQRQQFAARYHAHRARQAAELLVERLKLMPEVGRIEIAGSLRRWRETVKDIDLVATSRNPQAIMGTFTSMPQVERIVAKGDTKSSIVLTEGIPADLRVVDENQFAAALLYFSGSKEHNTQLRGRARRMGLKLNEYGLFNVGVKPKRKAARAADKNKARAQVSDEDDVDHSTTGELLAVKHEADIYRHLNLDFIPPELREGMGEIDAAEQGRIPRLIELKEMRGMIHCHTTYSDGHQKLRAAAADARRLGYEYMVICDHSQSAGYAGGLKVEMLEQQWLEIDQLNDESTDFCIFKGIESDIMADGSLDYSDEILAQFDLVVASIHSRMSMDEKAMTARVCRALEHPATRILGHPTGRLLLRRDPFGIDLDKVFSAAARHDVLIEINCNPHRLDLDWRFIRRAREAGCRFAVNPDSHSLEDMLLTRYGLAVARKGWLESGDVINTLRLDEFLRWLRGKHKK